MASIWVTIGSTRQYLAERIDRQLFIIVENVDPPSVIRGRDQTIFFSKNPQVGRYGFFPEMTKMLKS